MAVALLTVLGILCPGKRIAKYSERKRECVYAQVEEEEGLLLCPYFSTITPWEEGEGGNGRRKE